MKNRCDWLGTLAAMGFFGFLSVIPLVPVAHAADITQTRYADGMTPISQIQAGHIQDATLPSSRNGAMGIQDIQSMQYQPPQSINTMDDPTQPVSLTPALPESTAIPSFIVVPVMNRGDGAKAFADMPVMISTAVANNLTSKMSGLGISVINPLYAYDAIKSKGLEHVYQRMVDDYFQSGQPNEQDLTYLSDQLSTKSRHIDWVVFVESDLDMNQMAKTSIWQKPMAVLYDHGSSDPTYSLKGNVRIFGTQDGIPLIYKNASTTTVKMPQFAGFSRTVFDNTNSSYNFQEIASTMARSLMSHLSPESVKNRVDVQAKIVDSHTLPSNISPQDVDALKRVISN